MIKPHLSVSYLPLSSKSDLFYLLPQFSISYLKWPSACVYLQRSAAIERIQADNDIIMLQFQSNEIPSPTVNLRCWPLEGEGDHFAKKRLQQWGWGAQDFQTKEVKTGWGGLGWRAHWGWRPGGWNCGALRPSLLWVLAKQAQVSKRATYDQPKG